MADFDFQPDEPSEFDFQPDEPTVDTGRLAALEAEQKRLEKEREAAGGVPGGFLGALGLKAGFQLPLAKQTAAVVGALGDKTYEQALGETESLLGQVGRLEPTASGIGTVVGGVAPFLATGPVAAAARVPAAAGLLARTLPVAKAGGAVGGLQAAGQTAFTGRPVGEVALETTKGAAMGAAIPAAFGVGGKLARALAPKPTSGLLETIARRGGQALAKGATPAGMAVSPVRTILDPKATAEEKAAAAAELSAIGILPPALEAYKGTQRAALRRTRPAAGRAATEARGLVEAEQAAAGERAIAEQRGIESSVEAERMSSAERAIKEQRKAENARYEAEIDRLTNAELETRKRASQEQDLLQRQALEDQANQEKQQAAQLKAQIAKNTEAELEASRRTLEDDQLSLAQEQADLTAENKIWNDKNKRAFEAVKREQQIVAEAERMATADRATQEKEIATLQQELAAVRALEERLQTDTDPSLQGMVAKKFQDMYNRLNTAMEIMRQGGQEIPPAYVNAFDTVSESYLRNTRKGGYVGFGPDTELFIEDPIQWKERKRAEMVAKAQAEGGVLDQRIADALDVLANTQVDYLARARQAKALPSLPEDVIRDIFAIQDLQYTGGDLFKPDGTRIVQPFMGGRVPNAPFTSAESMQRNIASRRVARDRAEASRDARKAAEAALPRGKTVTQIQREARLAALRAQPVPTGISAKQEVRAAMEATTPRPAGMTEADILAARRIPGAPATPMPEADIKTRAGITPAAADAEFQARLAAARREVEFGTSDVTPETIRELNLESVPRAVWETLVPEQLRFFSRVRGPGSMIGGRIVEQQTPQFLGQQSALDPRQTRYARPFQALAIQDAFTKVLERNLADTSSRWAAFRAAAKNAGKFASMPEFLTQNPDIARAVSDELEQRTAAPE